jgi:hypothetical protein
VRKKSYTQYNKDVAEEQVKTHDIAQIWALMQSNPTTRTGVIPGLFLILVLSIIRFNLYICTPFLKQAMPGWRNW